MSAQDEPEQKASQSYLSKLSPWSRSPRIGPSDAKETKPPSKPPLQQQKGRDHVVSHRHRISLKKYPKDCPPLRPCWFHAVDVPKRRPHPAVGDLSEEKTRTIPKKFASFSVRDSKAIEAAFQDLLEEDENEEARTKLESKVGDISLQGNAAAIADGKPNSNLRDGSNRRPTRKVAVNEDYPFDVDVEARELAPAYWHGPVYDVRRGTWFYQDGNTQRPCDENLAAQLEEGYLKVKAWRLPSAQQAQSQKQASSSQPRARPTSWTPGQDASAAAKAKVADSTPITPHSSSGDLRSRAAEQAANQTNQTNVVENQGEQPQNTYRLFGSHMNSVVTYQDASIAWLLTDDFMSRMSSTMYSRFAGGGHFAGVKMTRGYVNPNKKPESKTEKAAGKSASKDQSDTPGENAESSGEEQRQSTSEVRRQNLTRQMSSLLEDPSREDPEKQDEEARRLDQREIEDDYKETEGDEQGREIEHLILVTHGIGQRLGLRLESVNFVHDVNTLRKTLKAVYADSPDLRALNAELGNTERVNSRVQVLPICWRHLLDFPKQSLKHNRKEHDLADADVDDDEFPSLEDITVEGVPAVRNLITDLALDILLYQSPAYKEHISRIVLSECNRIYRLFMERNPSFNGKVSLIGHSLGSAIMFDILCKQGIDQQPGKSSSKRSQDAQKLDFEVEDFYALGSPIGLFQMLKGRNIVAREKGESRRRAMSSMDDPMLDTPSLGAGRKTTPSLGAMGATPPTEVPNSSPKCTQLFNIFHPTDPISYRIEPLISPAMASLKPQPLPYTKRGIFGAPMGQGLTGIGARVSQSVSSMWSSMASSLLTRGLGYSGAEPTGQLPTSSTANLPGSQAGGSAKSSVPLSMGAGTNVSAGVIPTAPLSSAEGTQQEINAVNEDKQEQIANDALDAGKKGQHPPTLIDAEIETLYAGYEKRRKSAQSDSEASGGLGGAASMGNHEWKEAEERAKKLRREEEKVRKLNANGRVDYAIQEGVFDINLIAAIASHLSYWSDEDVSHFIVSQLLSRHRMVRPRAGSGAASGKTTQG
ncbi:DDHD-domain-containing protein [Hortaea werneckii]|nr:DDHD-domain-containing protein [Hortaea werneckii]